MSIQRANSTGADIVNFLLFSFGQICFSLGNANVEPELDDEDHGEEAGRDEEVGAREDVDGRPVEEPVGRLGHELDALGRDGEQGEGGAHLVLADQLGHHRVGDLLYRPVERVEEADEEEIGEAGAKGGEDPGSAGQGQGEENQRGVLGKLFE